MIEDLKEVKMALEHAIRIMEEEIYVTRDQEKALAKLDAVIQSLDADATTVSLSRSQVRTETRFNAVVTQLVRIHDSEEEKPQYGRYTHIECKDPEMLEPLNELARNLTQ